MVLMIFQSEIYSHLLVTFVYFFLVSVLRFKLDWGLFGLWIGALMGTFFLDIDHLIYYFVTFPNDPNSQEARRIWRTNGWRGWKEFLRFGKKVHYNYNFLIFHSAIGQIILVILAFYILTSGGSIFGSGFIMAVNLHLLKDEWWEYFFIDKGRLATTLFWQIREPKLRGYLREYLLVVSLIFLMMTGLLIRGI